MITVYGKNVIQFGRVGSVTYSTQFELTNKQAMDLMSAKKEAQEASKKEPGRMFYVDIDKEGECSVTAGKFTDPASAYAYKGGSEVPLPNAKAKKDAAVTRMVADELDKPEPKAKKKSARQVVEAEGGPAAKMEVVRDTPKTKTSKKSVSTKKPAGAVKSETTMEKAAKKSAKKSATKKAAKKVAPAKKAKAKAGERTVTPVAGTKKNMSIKDIRKAIKDGKVVRKPSGWYFSEAWASNATDQERKYEVYVKG